MSGTQKHDAAVARAINRLTTTIWVIVIFALLVVAVLIWLSTQTLVPK